MYVCVCVYIYIERERERCIYIYIYIYIYIHIYTCIHIYIYIYIYIYMYMYIYYYHFYDYESRIEVYLHAWTGEAARTSMCIRPVHLLRCYSVNFNVRMHLINKYYTYITFGRYYLCECICIRTLQFTLSHYTSDALVPHLFCLRPVHLLILGENSACQVPICAVAA